MAAGLGKRTRVDFPKVLLPLCGRSLVRSVIETARELSPERIVVVVCHGKDEVQASLADLPDLVFVDQQEPRGTGHAVQRGLEGLAGFAGDVLVLNGDGALVTAGTLRALVAARGVGAASLLSAHFGDPSGMGRVLRDAGGELTGIREERDCDAAELELTEINAGFYCFDSERLPAALAALTSSNQQGEYYVTDTIGHFLAEGQGAVAVVTNDPEEVQGVNSLEELAIARSIMQERILLQHLAAGVIIDDPTTTYIDHGVEIGAGTRVLPCTVICSGVTIGAGCEVGPFSHLRSGTVLEDGAAVGNFVEVKKSVLGRGAKAKHLTYLGDAVIGAKANIGAGTITANYDGIHKHQTNIGAGAFIGSGTVVVAPATIGDNATTGAGAVVTRNTDIAAGEVFIGVPARPLRPRKESS